METVVIEVADVDTVTVRGHVADPRVDVRQELQTRRQEGQDDRVDEHAGRRGLVVLAEQGLLFLPRLGRRVRHDVLADEMPARLSLVLGERLVAIPGVVLGVEQMLGALPEAHHGHREHGDQDVGVLARLEHGVAERDFLENLEVGLGRRDLQILDGLVDPDVVGAQDGTGRLLAHRRLVAARTDERHQLTGKLVALGVDDELCLGIAQTSGFQFSQELVLFVH